MDKFREELIEYALSYIKNEDNIKDLADNLVYGIVCNLNLKQIKLVKR